MGLAITITGITGGVGAGAGIVAGGAVGGGFGQAITNLCDGDPPQKDVLEACIVGGIGGAAGNGIGKGITSLGGTP